jgi:hypothetical protein
VHSRPAEGPTGNQHAIREPALSARPLPGACITPAILYAFDLVEPNGEDLRGRPLLEGASRSRDEIHPVTRQCNHRSANLFRLVRIKVGPSRFQMGRLAFMTLALGSPRGPSGLDLLVLGGEFVDPALHRPEAKEGVIVVNVPTKSAQPATMTRAPPLSTVACVSVPNANSVTFRAAPPWRPAPRDWEQTSAGRVPI